MERAIHSEPTASAIRPGSARPGKRLLTIGELLEMPPPTWQVEGLWPDGSLVELYGEPGAGKSFLALDWALSLASGLPWLGRKVRQGPTVYIAAEGHSGLGKRIKVWLASRSISAPHLFVWPHPAMIADEMARGELLCSIEVMGVPPALLVFDTLARCFGDEDENSAAAMGSFVEGCDTFRREYPGATTLVVHHSGKAKKGARGSTALLGAADTVMLLNRHGRDSMTLVCDKQKDAEPFKPIRLKQRAVALPNGENSCVFDLAASTPGVAEEADTGRDPRADRRDQCAFEALLRAGDGGALYSEWHKACDLKPTAFKAARRQLLETGKVRMDGSVYRIVQ